MFNLKSSQMSYLALSTSFEYLCYGSTAIINTINLFQCWDRFYKSESDIYRRQILTHKDGSRTERVSQIIQSVYFSYQEFLFCITASN